MRFLALVAAFMFVAMLPTHAQFAGAEPLTLSFSPQYPQPYDTVTLTITSTLINLPASSITVSVNGAVVAQNETKVAVAVGAPGTKTTVNVTAVTGDGQTYTATGTLLPAGVALIEEAVSSAHPFYRGASLVAPEGQVRLVAVPNFQSSPGVRISPDALIYNWKFGDRELQTQSGIGKSVLTATAPVRYRDAAVTVTVTTRDNTLVGQSSVIVSPVDPVVRLYRNEPLTGIDFENALSGTYALSGTEEAFRAIGYYFGTTPTIAWSLNGNNSGTDKDLTVRTTGTEAGTALLSADAKGSSVFETAAATLSVQFGPSKSGNFFGL